jgi:hypothetical protein
MSNRRLIFFRMNELWSVVAENTFMVSQLISDCVMPWSVFVHVIKYEMVLFIKKINEVVINKFSFLWEFRDK